MYQTIAQYAKANKLTPSGVKYRIDKGLIPPDRVRKNDGGKIEIKVRDSESIKTNELISKLRNSYGHDKRDLMLSAANEIETWKEAYENMRDWALENGLDINTYNN